MRLDRRWAWRRGAGEEEDVEAGGWTSHAGDGSKGRRSRYVEVDIGEITDEGRGDEGVAEDEYASGWVDRGRGKGEKNASRARRKQRVNGGGRRERRRSGRVGRR